MPRKRGDDRRCVCRCGVSVSISGVTPLATQVRLRGRPSSFRIGVGVAGGRFARCLPISISLPLGGRVAVATPIANPMSVLFRVASDNVAPGAGLWNGPQKCINDNNVLDAALSTSGADAMDATVVN
jgi:hypothetical protein